MPNAYPFSAPHRTRCISFFFRPALGLAAMLIMAGCATVRPPAPVPPPAAPASAPKPHSFWNDEGMGGSPSIVISLGKQRAYFYRAQHLVGESLISSGRKKFPTPTGSFKVIQRDRDHVSNLYGDYVDEGGEVVQRNVDVTRDPVPAGAHFRGAKMPFFLRFTGGTGLHAGRLPGYPASHGCVRMPRFMAEHFFANAPLGTPVSVED